MSQKQKEHSIQYTRDSKECKSTGTGDNIEFKQSHDVFDNSMVKAALDALTPKDRERYLAMGEEMYGHVNFEDAKALKNTDPPMMEALAYVENQLRSGLHPSDMDDNEKALLADHYGPEWYTKFNFVKEDLDDIVTVKH